MSKNSAELLLTHALSVEWAALPPAAQAAARTFLHDTLCVGVAGRAAPDAERIWAAVQGWFGPQQGLCSVLGRPGMRATAPYAAFMNAYQIHAQEFDCVHEPAVAHPMATVVATMLADTERSGPIQGEEFLAALCAGVDMVATLGVAVTTPLRFFRPATAGIFGSVAALCRLHRLPLPVAMNAFGHALAYASGTMQAHLEGKPTLALQVAGAARSAVESLDLALAGIAAPADSITGPFGYLSLFEGGYALDAPLAELGRRWRINELSWKPFPTGRAAHGAIVATQQLLAAGTLTAAGLDHLVYHAPPLIARLVGRPAFKGMGPAHARLCFAYLGAVVLLRGEVTLKDFTPERLADAEVLALATRITVQPDDNPNPAAFVPALLVAHLSDGRRAEQAVSRQFGSPEWPLSREQHLDKARACLAFGGLSDAVHEALAQLFERFECEADVAGAIAGAMAAG